MRSIRLLLGIIAIGEWISTYEILIGIAGIVLLTQALLNIGCMGGTCAPVRNTKHNSHSTETITYEEIK